MGTDSDSFISASRDVEPAFTLFSTGRYALAKARKTNEGSFLELLTANLMVALALEAFLNKAGLHIWGHDSAVWAGVERLSPLAKLKAIAEDSDFVLDFGSRPAQTMTGVTRFRNAIAHAKPELLEAEVAREVAEAGLAFPEGAPELTAEWEQNCTIAFAERALDDLAELTEKLSLHIGIANPLHIGGVSVWG